LFLKDFKYSLGKNFKRKGNIYLYNNFKKIKRKIDNSKFIDKIVVLINRKKSFQNFDQKEKHPSTFSRRKNIENLNDIAILFYLKEKSVSNTNKGKLLHFFLLNLKSKFEKVTPPKENENVRNSKADKITSSTLTSKKTTVSKKK
jgi:tRNA G10  N-methylase Trm11